MLLYRDTVVVMWFDFFVTSFSDLFVAVAFAVVVVVAIVDSFGICATPMKTINWYYRLLLLRSTKAECKIGEIARVCFFSFE